MIKELSIDLETFSDVDIRDGGADKNLDYYRTPKGVFICIPKNKNQLH